MMSAAETQIATLLDYANDLKRLPRTGWLLAGVRDVESIADHSFATTILALALAEAVNRERANAGEPPLNIERVLKIALAHDLAESVVTDLPKRTSQLLGDDVKHDAESRAWAQILPSPDAAEWREWWAEYDGAETPEALLVRDADKLEMAHQALRYAHSGVQGLEDFWQPRAWAYPISARVRQRLLERFGIAESASPGELDD